MYASKDGYLLLVSRIMKSFVIIMSDDDQLLVDYFCQESFWDLTVWSDLFRLRNIFGERRPSDWRASNFSDSFEAGVA
jgi:hypothetical protein